MPDHPPHFTITAHLTRALWPGGRAICARLSAPRFFPDMWFLGSGEKASELRAFRYGMFGRRL